MADFFNDDDDFFSDEQTEQDIYKFYDKESQRPKQPYEDHYEKLQFLLDQYTNKINEYQDQHDFLVQRLEKPLIHNLQMSYEKDIGIFNILSGDNKTFNKITAIFVILEKEVTKIYEKFEFKYFDQIVMYSQMPEDHEGKIKDGDAEIFTGRMLQCYKEIFDEVKRINQIIQNYIQQLHNLLNKHESLYKQVFHKVSVYSVLNTLSKALSILYTVDSLVKENENIKNHWNSYKTMLKIIKTDHSKYQATDQQVKVFEKILIKIDKLIINSSCLKIMITQSYDINVQQPQQDTKSKSKKNTGSQLIADNKELFEFMTKFLKIQLANFQEQLTSNTETLERQQIIQFLSFYSLYRKLFPQEEDRNLFKAIWSLQKKVPVVCVHSHVLCYIHEFLSEYAPLTQKSKNLDPKDPTSFLRIYLQKQDEQFEKNINNLYTHFTTWVVRLDSNLISNLSYGDKQIVDNTNLILDRLNFRCKLLMTGVLIANQVSNLLKTCMLLHIHQKIEITSNLIGPFIKGIEMLQAIDKIIISKEKQFPIQIMYRLLTHQFGEKLIKEQQRIKKQFHSSKSTEQKSILTAIQEILNIIKGPYSFLRYSALQFLVNFVTSKGVLKEQDADEIQYMLFKINVITNHRYYFSKATDTTFLFWIRELFPNLFQFFFQNPNEAKRLQYLIYSFEKAEKQLNQSIHITNPKILFDSYKHEVVDSFNKEYLQPLSIEIEDFLRISIHKVLLEKIKGVNPFTDNNVRNLEYLLDIGTISFFDLRIDVKDEVSKYLNSTFYDINVLNMYDFQIYEEIRSLAKKKYNLQLINVYIPSQTLEQGENTLDILNILRNINKFVLKFNYNLYTQTFIEVAKDKKDLHTIGIRQISDSMQTHGLGILSTTINYVYQFIIKKFQVFSEFLFDDMIQSLLIRESKYFKENRHKLENQQYPYEKAEQVYKEVKKLGQFQDGQTYMDKFRLLITQIGNTLGFVRLIRGASLNSCSQNIEYLPELETDINFSELAKNAKFGLSTINAASDLDDNFNTLKNNFSSRTDYLKLLMSTLEQIVASSQSDHLKLFYHIIPPLSLNFVDHVLIAKEKLIRKNAQDAFISDDGFALGLAYFLKLLGQTKQFESLHWGNQVRAKLASELKKNEQQFSNVSKRQQEELDLQKGMSQKQLQSKLEEFNIFLYTFEAAIILFRDMN